jgi:P-type E1-E2 ATPase
LEASATIRVLVSIDGAFAGIIDLADELRPNAKQALDRLRATGITRIAMLTGDNEVTAKHVAEELGIDEVHAELLPEDKLSVIQTMQRDGHRVAMIGDGVNDAPALATADVGVAMGAVGTQAALEAADIALMTDDLGQILAARTIAAKAYRTIKENLFVGVGFVHVAGIIAALLGLIGPVQAAIIHLGPDLLVFLNSTKLLRLKLDT